MVGCRGLQWPGLLPLLFNGYKGPAPHILIIHLGGNNLGLIKGKALVWHARYDFVEIKRCCLAGLVCHDSKEGMEVMKKVQKGANQEIHRILEQGLGFYVPHPDISVFR